MRTSIIGIAAMLAATLAAASVAHGDVIIKLKNGVEIKVPVNKDDIASITMEEGGRSASASPPSAPPPPVVPETPAKPTEYSQAPPSPEELAQAKGPELPGASGFKPGAFSKDGAAGGSSGRIVHVGPGKDYEKLGDVAASLQNGDVVEIEGGLYLNDFASIAASDITLRGVHGRPHFRATVGPPNNKGIRSSEKFVDRAKYDFHLADGADAIDDGVKVGNAGKTSLMPANEYAFPKPMTPRKVVGDLDVGAYEYGGK